MNYQATMCFNKENVFIGYGEELLRQAEPITINQAREVFKNNNLSYSLVGQEQFQELWNILFQELHYYRHNGGEHAEQMSMTPRSIRHKDKKFINNKIIRGEIKINGSYFSGREGITFNENGFIGFGGELSDVNRQPIVRAFIIWCNWMANKEKENCNVKVQ